MLSSPSFRLVAPCLLAILLTATSLTDPSGARQPGRLAVWPASQVTAHGPVVDGTYVQAELAYLAMRDQRREAGRGHEVNQGAGLSPGPNEHDRFAADWLHALRADLAGLPLQVTRQSFRLPGFNGRPPKAPGSNLIVTVPGTTHAREWVLLVAHYDGMPWSTQSAFDDGSGCAILLGVARAMAPVWRQHRPARTVAFILFDGEEQGLIGSFYAAHLYRQGAPYRIVALYNEEQNGVGYPIRPFGLTSNAPLPEYAFVTPQHHGSHFAAPVPSRFWPELQRFSSALAVARGRAFAALHAVYPQLTYHPGVALPTFTTADERLVPIGDDTVGGSDEAPFERLGLPTATFVSNYDYYERHHHPWSYPYDTPFDTMALLERTASGVAHPSPTLAAALALPGQLTVAMLTGSAWGDS